MAEALELSTFLAQVAKSRNKKARETAADDDLNDLRVTDWAHIWMQVIRELRKGVMLKKVDYDSQLLHPIEYELTPYEMLLDDIRLQRYKLNKVDSQTLSLSVRKDAHALILDFIRSRPPLVPVGERKLSPMPRREQTLYEKLMDSIKQKHHLKPTPDPAFRRSSVQLGRIKEDGSQTYTKKSSADDFGFGLRRCGSMPLKKKPSERKLIKADLALNFDSDSDSEDLPSSCTSSSPDSAPGEYTEMGLITDIPARPKQTMPASRPSHSHLHRRSSYGFGSLGQYLRQMFGRSTEAV